MQVGDTVLALGSPLGLEGSVTAGIISAKDRTIRPSPTAGAAAEPVRRGQQQQQTTRLAVRPAADRRADQPGQLRRRAGQHQRRGDRHQHRDRHLAARATATSASASRSRATRPSRSPTTLRNGEKVSHPALGVSVTETENGGGALVSAVTAEQRGRQGRPAAGRRHHQLRRQGDQQLGRPGRQRSSRTRSVTRCSSPSRRNGIGKDRNRDARRSVITARYAHTWDSRPRDPRDGPPPKGGGWHGPGGWSCSPATARYWPLGHHLVTGRPKMLCVAVG